MTTVGCHTIYVRLSLRLSISLSRSDIVSKRLYVSSNCFHYVVTPSLN